MKPSEILARHRTDKVTCHSYGPLYDSLLPPYRERAKNVLELGILEGCSLRAWQEFFPNATIYGIDGDVRRLIHDEPRIVSYHADTADRDHFINVCAALPPLDIVVDDASHMITEQIWAVCCLWDRLAPGGLYIVEDIAQPQHLPLFRAFQNVELHDLRRVQDRYDDMVAVLRKP